MAGQVGNSASLASMLAQHRDQIAEDWAGAVDQMLGSHYRQLPRKDLSSAATRCIDAIIDALIGGSLATLDGYLQQISVVRLEQQFDIGEVTEGLLLLRENITPFLWRSFSPGSLDAYEALIRLDGCVRYMIARFSHLYAEAMQRHLQEQQELTARRLSETQSLQKVTAALLQKSKLEDALEVVCAEARQLTGAIGSAVFLLEEGMEESGWLRVAFGSGAATPAVDRVPVSGSLSGMVVVDGHPYLTNDPNGAPCCPYPWSVPLTSLLIVPLRANGTPIGALDLVNKPGGFADDDARITTLLADQAAVAIEHARLHRRVEQLVIMEERQRLARELHDSVTQSLYSVTLFAEAAAGLVANGRYDRAVERLRQLRDPAQDALREMRLLIFELHPVELEKSGLIAALQARLEAVESRGGLQSTLIVEGNRRLPAKAEETLYRIAQEALNNVLKHASARSGDLLGNV